MRKRAFDLAVLLMTAPFWTAVVAGSALVLLVSNGRPVFYRSSRRVFRDHTLSLLKFRVMVRNADRLVNRLNVSYNGTRFLNLPIHADVYTPAGRIIELLSLTELPQIFHVITGRMSLVGNRPLPQNVVDALREAYPSATERFDAPCGLTGPVQLVGRHRLTDHERLTLEIAYCRLVSRQYCARFDLFVLVTTVLICLGLRARLTFETVRSRLVAAARSDDIVNFPVLRDETLSERGESAVIPHVKGRPAAVRQRERFGVPNSATIGVVGPEPRLFGSRDRKLSNYTETERQRSDRPGARNTFR